MEEPTRGVDVGAKSEIYRLMNRLTADGISIILVSSDIPELVAMSDRVLVLREGRIVRELVGDDITQHNVLDYSLRGRRSDFYHSIGFFRNACAHRVGFAWDYSIDSVSQLSIAI